MCRAARACTLSARAAAAASLVSCAASRAAASARASAAASRHDAAHASVQPGVAVAKACAIVSASSAAGHGDTTMTRREARAAALLAATFAARLPRIRAARRARCTAAQSASCSASSPPSAELTEASPSLDAPSLPLSSWLRQPWSRGALDVRAAGGMGVRPGALISSVSSSRAKASTSTVRSNQARGRYATPKTDTAARWLTGAVWASGSAAVARAAARPSALRVRRSKPLSALSRPRRLAAVRWLVGRAADVSSARGEATRSGSLHMSAMHGGDQEARRHTARIGARGGCSAFGKTSYPRSTCVGVGTSWKSMTVLAQPSMHPWLHAPRTATRSL